MTALWLARAMRYGAGARASAGQSDETDGLVQEGEGRREEARREKPVMRKSCPRFSEGFTGQLCLTEFSLCAVGRRQEERKGGFGGTDEKNGVRIWHRSDDRECV